MISRFSPISAAALLLASAGAAAAFPATVTTDLNVRSGPGTGYSVVDSLQAGDTVEVVQDSGSWYQLADGGWASANYLDAEGSAAVEGYDDPGYAVADSYPSYYGSPAFYYGSDPFFWDDGGYYWYWRGGQRHRVSDNWWRGHNRRDFRWSNDNNRRDWERRTRRADISPRNDGPRMGNNGPRRNLGNDGPRRNVGNDGPRRRMDGQPAMRTGRASVQGGPRVEGRGIQGGGSRMDGGSRDGGRGISSGGGGRGGSYGGGRGGGGGGGRGGGGGGGEFRR